MPFLSDSVSSLEISNWKSVWFERDWYVKCLLLLVFQWNSVSCQILMCFTQNNLRTHFISFSLKWIHHAFKCTQFRTWILNIFIFAFQFLAYFIKKEHLVIFCHVRCTCTQASPSFFSRILLFLLFITSSFSVWF